MGHALLRAAACAAVLIAGCSSRTGEAPPEPRTLFAAGDTILARWMHRKAEGRTAAAVFEGLAAEMSSADLTFLNLESVLSSRGTMVDFGGFRPFPYRGRPELVRLLTESGVDVVSQANNHAGDYGPAALTESVAVLEGSGVIAAGAGENAAAAARVRTADARGVRTAWIAFQTIEPDIAAGERLAGTFFVREDRIAREVAPLVRRARKTADFVAVSAHWGGNWGTRPSERRRKAARALIGAGADVVLGHSAHVLQGIEIHKGRPILYDMGMFLTDTVTQAPLRESMRFLIEFDVRGVTAVKARPIYLDAGTTRPAEERRARAIADMFLARTRELAPRLDPVWENGEVVVRLDPPARRRTPRLEDAPPPEPPYEARKPSCVVPAPPAGLAPVTAAFANGVELRGVSVPGRVEYGTAFVTRLLFRAAAAPAGKADVHVVLYDAAGRRVWSNWHEAGDWSYPVDRWLAEEWVYDVHLFRPPTGMPIGVYDVYLELRAPGGGPVPSAAAGERGVRLGSLEVYPALPKRQHSIAGLVPYALAGETPA